MNDTPRLRCAGCGVTPPPDEPYPFRCPGAAPGDDRDHVLVPLLAPPDRFADPDATEPFVRYRAWLYSHALALSHGLKDSDYVALVAGLDAAVAAVDGAGFRVTPCEPRPALAARLGMAAGTVWAKDETGNVSGSHKARHLMGIALTLEVAERTGLASRAESDRRGLAIASCGNAALAAAVVARASRRPLGVFIPEDADPRVVARLSELGAAITVCPRVPGRPGDPCVHAFHAAVAQGALPFCCQGNENGLAIEGGKTLGYELAERLVQQRAGLDRLFVQVGGGALASGCIQGLRDAVAHGLLAHLPRVHAVQTEGAWPLRRAYERVRERVLGGPVADDAAGAESLREPRNAAAIERALDHAREHRSAYMWAWETPPHSIAHGILDDETYDWVEVVDGMIDSGGWPVTVSEPRLDEALRVARGATDVRADATGTSGLAGLIELRASGNVDDGERVAVLLTGVER